MYVFHMDSLMLTFSFSVALEFFPKFFDTIFRGAVT